MPKIPEQIATLISVSQTYFEDGATQTAADRLHKAAEMMAGVPRPTPKVKPLVFDADNDAIGFSIYRCQTPIGIVSYGTDKDGVSWYLAPDMTASKDADSEADAKAVLQADYERAILSHPVVSALEGVE